MSGKDKVEPGLFFDLVADGAGPRTKAARGAQNMRVKGGGLTSGGTLSARGWPLG